MKKRRQEYTNLSVDDEDMEQITIGRDKSQNFTGIITSSDMMNQFTHP